MHDKCLPILEKNYLLFLCIAQGHYIVLRDELKFQLGCMKNFSYQDFFLRLNFVNLQNENKNVLYKQA